MSAQLLLPPRSVLNDERSALLARLTEGLDVAALNWVSGYAAGLAARSSALHAVAPALEVTGAPAAVSAVTVLYGSQTGNARREAERLQDSLRASGNAVRLLRADAYPLRELTTESLLFVVISTQGEGEPPDDARALFDHLQSRRAPRLEALQFSVLGLGDSSYAQFNASGRWLDERLQALGGQRLLPRAEADTDIDTVAAPWRRQALERVQALRPNPDLQRVVPLVAVAPSAPRHAREHPVSIEVLSNQRITARDSAQDVRHLELSITDISFDYEPGDALAIWPQNAPILVDRVLSRLQLSGSESVRIGDEIRSLHDWLGGHRELTRLHRGFLKQHAERAGASTLNALLAATDADAVAAFVATRQLDDVLREFPVSWSASELVAALRPLTPRSYSIASSRKAVGDELHLTVAVLESVGVDGVQRGVASGFLADASVGTTVIGQLVSNDRFRLPADASRDLLMIGPGTGVAPFRGFVQERSALGATGRNWLFFGARHARSQFLYQLEWQAALRDGQLQRLDLAFSRDQAERIHVQQRLVEQGRDVCAWLQGGAHLYVCGGIAMGRSVHAALSAIVVAHGGHSVESANEYLNALQQSGRYARDVY